MNKNGNKCALYVIYNPNFKYYLNIIRIFLTSNFSFNKNFILYKNDQPHVYYLSSHKLKNPLINSKIKE
ncbi:hypothetical protein GLOIN_2v1570704 [Rhizophagus irregularis DAOM 181602=DAOM 197198]|uniref:Uncharacterized protein n=1 Tax=Rhizophagus irregularis (strain DAOM 181602 / DAOM 197198 / MUCL 43194) TaxID=747089 RepID=A0A2P4QBS3_RHIID|nr:hypothetical protein GLOIN_2v1570704 [Rhizophagus irregularis DAOM 181602=DAOM 197198]POG75088.1 hypothetical protein GLOIN_2v1570704 [Rhizophagus irregularis DAOM 181602=DAOM 197198]GET51178.1 hypothetical protein GLOIN_2v1570704 [Rhizophagus irregularis DAOM 181602=DAOM 197198]|eukprot:XP_025181954.1 hypothetical protein GLOIN_2v1570704 [Rhizophagus irregularis DAOM 181602=DAOM 197198]